MIPFGGLDHLVMIHSPLISATTTSDLIFLHNFLSGVASQKCLYRYRMFIPVNALMDRVV